MFLKLITLETETASVWGKILETIALKVIKILKKSGRKKDWITLQGIFVFQ